MARVEPVSQASAQDTANGTLSAAAAGAGTVVADTGQLAAGTYDVEYSLAVLGVATAGVGLVIEHRNAANSANISVLGGCACGASETGKSSRVTVALNERIRVVVGAVALPASTTAAARLDAHRLP